MFKIKQLLVIPDLLLTLLIEVWGVSGAQELDGGVGRAMAAVKVGDGAQGEEL